MSSGVMGLRGFEPRLPDPQPGVIPSYTTTPTKIIFYSVFLKFVLQKPKSLYTTE